MLVPGFPAKEAETDCLPAVQNFVKALARRNPNISVHVVSFHYPFAAGVYTWNGVRVCALAGRNKAFPMRFRTWLRAIAYVRRLIKAENVIALHSFWLAECSYVAAWLARMTGARHIATICGQDALSDNPYLKRLRFDRMTITAGSSRAAAAFHQSTGFLVNHVIPAGLDAEALTPPDETAERPIDILGVGSLIPIKDYRSFIDVVAALAGGRSSLRCVILGEGPERPSLESQIKERRLQDVVRLAGHVSREEVLKTMRHANILLHTSRYEGQGYVFLEALAAGMRVVCREVGYTGEGPAAYTCTSNEEMVDVLKRLLDAARPKEEVRVESIDCTARAFEKIYGIHVP